MRKRAVITVITVLTVVILFLVGLSVLTRTTNCGGNSAALAYTHEVALTVQMVLEETESGTPFEFSSIIPPSSWPEVFRFGWGVKSYWVRKKISPSDTAPIVICAQYFGNVPQPNFCNLYSRNPCFAAGFVNGESRLLERTEYNSVNFDEYFYINEDEVSKQELQGKSGRRP